MVDEEGKPKSSQMQGEGQLTEAEVLAYNTIRQYEEQVHGFALGMAWLEC